MTDQNDTNRRKILHMIPLSEFEQIDGVSEQQTETFSDENIRGINKLGEILKGISTRHRMDGYYIINSGIYTSNDESIYEKLQPNEAN